MRLKFYFFFSPLVLLANLLPAQVSKDAAIAVTASFTTSPAGVTLSWPNPAASSLVILRHTKTSPPNLWLSMLSVSNSTQTTLVDNLVSPGQVYEYVVKRTVGNVVSYGYAHVALNAPVVDNRGKLLFFVDSTLMGPLANEVGQLKLDMMGDGWTVVPHIIGSGATVQSMKNLILADYNADPTSVKMVFLLGALPVPYSGNTNWDGHAEHQGAWPADSYYADINGLWTDVSINNTTASRAANDNVPGDGKFDQSTIPGNVELAVGRVDFRHLSPTTFGTSQVELYRRYLNKDHAWRMHEYTVANKAIVDDNFGYFNGEAFAANGFRNAYPLVGAANIVEGDFFDNTNPDSYLLGIGVGGGSYTSASGVGTSADFATDTVNVVFSMLFGSYHGDWDYESDPFMPAALASKGGILTCSWAGRPHVFYQGLSSGETVGYCTQETQNAVDNTGFFPSYGESGAHVSLLGDPSLRAHVVAPPKDLVAVAQCSTVGLNWSAPSGGAPGGGYMVYRSLVRNGTYTRLTATSITGTSYTDLTPPSDTLFYQVRAIEPVTTPGGGTYFNNSLGATTFLVFTPGTAPELTTTGGTVTCGQPIVTLTVSSSLPIDTAFWQSGQAIWEGVSAEVSTPGIFTVTVTATNGCTATEVALVSSSTTSPTFSGSAGTLTCNSPSVTLNAGVANATVSWSGPNGFASNLDNPSVTIAGVYAATVTSNANGCTQTGNVNVLIDTFLPVFNLPFIHILTCQVPCSYVILPSVPGFQLYLDGSLLFPNSSISFCTPGQHSFGFQSLTNGCQDDYPFTITQNITPPGASATGGTISCNMPFQLQGTSSTPNVLYHWTGPGNFSSNLQNPLVSGTGTYTLVVTNPVNGCKSTATALVSNPDAPNVNANGVTLTCSQLSGILQGNSTTPGVTYLWTGPNGFTSTQQNPTVTAGGSYQLVVTAPNGCTNIASVNVGTAMTIPDVSVIGDTLSCSHLTAIIHGQSNTPDVTYSWSGPNGFTSTEQNPAITQVGTYTLTVEAPNGCTNAAEVQVDQIPSPNFSTTSYLAVDCQGVIAFSLNPVGGTPPYQYVWSTGATTDTIYVYSGTVRLTVTDAAGCQAISPFLLLPTNTPIQYNSTVFPEIDQLHNGSLAIHMSGGPACQNYSYLWSTGDTTETISNLAAGAYMVTITCTASGCTYVATGVVYSSTSSTEDVIFWKKLRLAPNPANDETLLELEFPTATILQIKVLDGMGRLMLHLPETTLLKGSLPLDLRHCPPGMYTVMVLTKAGIATRKLVVVK